MLIVWISAAIPSQLCIEAARDPDRIDWANRRARHRVIPEGLNTLWTPPPAEAPHPNIPEGLP
jgi:hypothetical protein